MSVKQRLVTAEEFYEMPDRPGYMLELVAGEIAEVTGTGFSHNQIAGLVYRLLWQHVEQHHLGTVAGENLGYVLRRNPDTVRVPDVSFLAWGREPSEDAAEFYVEGPPTIAVEVVSPNDRDREIRAKVSEYLTAGSQQVWVLRPTERSVTVHDADRGVRELGADVTLDGGDVLPGFSVRVGDLFEIPRRR